MVRPAVIWLSLGLLFGRCALALNPASDVSQYAHTAWRIRDGFFKGVISSVVQMPDGYLLLGTEFGLVRFDGISAAQWTPPGHEDLPPALILTLFVARDGSIWIGADGALAHWSRGKVTRYPELEGYRVRTIVEDEAGTIWVGAYSVPTGKLYALRSGTIQCSGQDAEFGRDVISLYAAGGSLWAAAETGLWRLIPGPRQQFSGFHFEATQTLEGAADGRLLVTSDGRIRQIVNGKVEEYAVRTADRLLRPYNLFRDRDGGLWVGSADLGLALVQGDKTSLFAGSDGLSGDRINNFFEDREGNIWVATNGGLDRFRELPVSTVSIRQGLSTDAVESILAATDGAVWITSRNGLNRWKSGQLTIFRKSSGLPDDDPLVVFQDDRERVWASSSHGLAWFKGDRFVPIAGSPGGQVHAIAGDKAGDLWLSEQRNLMQVRDGRVVKEIPWSRFGRKQPALVLVSDPERGGLWMGFVVGGGIQYFQDGEIRASYTAGNGLGRGVVAGIQLDRDGTIWASTEGGLSRIKNGHIATLTVRNGLPCDTIRWTIEDDEHSFWLYTSCGLVHITRTELEAWATNHDRMIHTTLLDANDGVRLTPTYISGHSPHVAKASDGRLWFVTTEGVQVIDPRHLVVNTRPPPVHVEKITSDYEVRWQDMSGKPASDLRLPALTHDVEIDYTALSFVSPEKVRFRVKLEGHDPDWKDVGNERKAFYNDLPPRNYRLRVAASNNSGVWNEAGASFDFSIDPAYYQTGWFQASCVAAFLALLWALYRFRLHQIAQEFNIRLEERVGERTRIARDLHDTLLQSFQGLLLRFQVVDESLPPGKAKEELERTLDLAARAITEGRDTVQGLRSSTVETNDLASAIRALGEELAGDETNPNRVECSLVVEGTPRDLHPILRDEVYRITGEALRNAFRHAQARRIEVAIGYAERQFQLRVRDDGRGIDPEVLDRQARAGHFGMPGMRERAELIGANLEVWSQRQSGTEVRLNIPASIAYAVSSRARRSRLLTKMPFARKTGTNS